MATALFGLDARGALTPRDDEARKALEGRAGDHQLLPTAPDLLLLVRAKPSGQHGTSPRVVLAGDASGFPLSDLVAFLAQARWSGTVRVHAPSGQRQVWLKDGEIRGASSELLADRLGEVVLRLGYIKRRELEAVLRDTPPSKLGRALVDRGFLQAHDLYKCITHQVSEIFHAIVLCREGPFVLLDQEGDDRNAPGLQLSTQSLLMDSIRKVDELAHFRKRIPHGRLYVGRKKPSDGSLEEDEERVLGLVTGQLTVQELGQEAKLSEFDITKVVYRLLEGGFAQVAEHPVTQAAEPQRAQAGSPAAAGAVASAGGAPARDAGTVIRTFNDIFREIFTEVRQKGRGEDLLDAANAALNTGGLTDSPVMVAVSFDAQGQLPASLVLARYEGAKAQLGTQPLAALRQALSDVMFFLLFQAGELLEQRADEELARRVKLLLATLDWI